MEIIHSYSKVCCNAVHDITENINIFIVITNLYIDLFRKTVSMAALAQLGERQTEDLKAPCSIHGGGKAFVLIIYSH